MPSPNARTTEDAVSRYGRDIKAKFAALVLKAEPEDQLRNPLEDLLRSLAEAIQLRRDDVTLIGEASLAEIHSRPDFAVSVRGVQSGFIEVKRPGKGADPRRYSDKHDTDQWKRLQTLPNLLYTDGQEFALFHNGELFGDLIRLEGDVRTAGDALRAPEKLLAVIEEFLTWEPTPPTDAPALAVTAAYCRS